MRTYRFLHFLIFFSFAYAILARPLYQDAAVAGYLQQLGSTYQGRYNKAARAFPDVAAQGEKIAIAHRGQFVLVDGTSASAPIFASIVALINDRRLAKARKPLGFLNPSYTASQPFGTISRLVFFFFVIALFLAGTQKLVCEKEYYNNMTFLSDILGSNPSCGTQGFPAKTGFDW